MNTKFSRPAPFLLAFLLSTALPTLAQTPPKVPDTTPAAPDATKAADSKTVTPDTKAVQKELQASVNQMDSALKRKDLQGVMHFFAPTYKLKDLKGKTLTVQQVKDDYRSLFSQAQNITTASSTIENVTMKKSDAEATGKSTLKATVIDSKGKSHEMAQSGSGLLTWKKTKDGWQIVGGKTLSLDQTYDGKPYSAFDKQKTASTTKKTSQAARRNSSGWRPYRMPRASVIRIPR